MLDIMIRVVALSCVLSIAGCGKSADPFLAKTRLTALPVVSGGTEIDRDALVLTLDDRVSLYKNGQPAGLEGIAVRKGKEFRADLDPVILEFHPTLTLKQCTPLLNAVIAKAFKGNLGFLVSTPAGRRIVLLPVLRDIGYLSLTTGLTNHDERDWSPEAQRHLWLSFRVGSSGTHNVESIQYRRFDEMWFQASDKPGWIEPLEWNGHYPPLGNWPETQIRDFLGEQRIRDLSPFLDLKVLQGDKIEDVVRCLDALHRVAPGRVVVSLMQQ